MNENKTNMKLQLSKTLKELLKENDLTIAQLSRATKVPAQTLNNWLSGLEPRNMTQVKIVASYFGKTIDELAYNDQEKVKKTYVDPFADHEDDINAGIFEVILRRVKK